MSKQAGRPVHPRTAPVSPDVAQSTPAHARLILSRKPDNRFALHGLQPRSKQLGRPQYKLCRVDPAFKEALRVRVSNPARWEAFMANIPFYIGKVCKRCQGQRRRVYQNGCYDCLLSRNKGDFGLIRQGIMPPSYRSRAGWLDAHERKARERAGECTRHEVGPYTAYRFPTGRVRLIAPHIPLDVQNLREAIPGERLYYMASADPDLLELLRRLGWADRSSRSQVPLNQEAKQQQPAHTAITAMVVHAHPSVLDQSAISGPVDIAITKRNGERYKRPLATLDELERAALFGTYWHSIPASIRLLGDTPEKAFSKYVASKARGYIRD